MALRKPIHVGADGLPRAIQSGDTLDPVYAPGAVLAHTQDFRLSTESGVPASTADRTAQGTLYAVPTIGNQMALLDASGTVATLYTSAQFSLALSGLTLSKNYDVFAYYNAGGTFGVRGTGTAGFIASTGTTYAAALPTSVTGDLLVVAVILDAGTGTAVTVPAGWTSRLTGNSASTGTTLLMTKTSAGETSVTFTSLTAGSALAYSAHAIQNGAWDTGLAATGGSFVTTLDAPSVTASASGNLLFSYFLAANGAAFTGPASETKVNASGACGGYEVLAASGATGVRTATVGAATYLAAFAASVKSVAAAAGLYLEKSAAWTSDTARADAVSFVGGVWVKSSDFTRRLLGSFRASGTATTEDTEASRWVYNLNNQVTRTIRTSGPAATVTSTSTSFALIGTSFAAVALNGNTGPVTASAWLSLLVTNAAPATQDFAAAIKVGGTSYELTNGANDTAALIRLTGARDVPLPFGAIAIDAQWAIVGGGGTMSIPATARGVAARPMSSSLQLSYPG